MNCDEYLPLISGHLDGVNSEIEERRLQEHLETCEACRVLLSQMEQNDALLQSAATPPADLTDRIMNAVRKEKRTAKKRWIPIAASGLAAAALLGLVFMHNLPIMNGASSKDSAAVEEIVENGWTQKAQAPLAPYDELLTSACAPVSGVADYSLQDGSVYDDLGSSESPAEENESHIYRSSIMKSSPTPMLIVWTADQLNTLANFAPETADTLSAADGSPLYQRILLAIPLHPEAEDGYGITVYCVSYDTLEAVFDECLNVYENAVYYPAAFTEDTTCNVVLIADNE